VAERSARLRRSRSWHPEAHRAALSENTSYATFVAEARNEMEWNPEWSRRARGFATYAALRSLGRDGVSGLVERCCKHAKSLGTRMGNCRVRSCWLSRAEPGAGAVPSIRRRVPGKQNTRSGPMM